MSDNPFLAGGPSVLSLLAVFSARVYKSGLYPGKQKTIFGKVIK